MLSVRNLVKSFPSRAGGTAYNVIDDVSFAVAQGAFFTLLGPSGCGKTTTLQCIAGLETPTSGRIEIDGRAVFCSRERLLVPPNRRDLGMIFQSYAIWPHMTVFDNVAFPLVHGRARTPAGEVRRRVMDALALVKLQDFAARPSPQLSGGQQQRVALARALVHSPRLLLLDEPLSNLDAALRDIMRVELRALVTSLGITTVFVTHDQVEAMAMSDQILLLRGGRVVQQGAPRDIYLRPASVFAADFMGRSNVIAGRVAAPGEVVTALGPLRCEVPAGLGLGAEVALVIRPRAVRAAAREHAVNVVRGTVTQLQFVGDAIEVDVTVAGLVVRTMLDPYHSLALGQPLSLELPPERCVVVPADAAAAGSVSDTAPLAPLAASPTERREIPMVA